MSYIVHVKALTGARFYGPYPSQGVAAGVSATLRMGGVAATVHPLVSDAPIPAVPDA